MYVIQLTIQCILLMTMVHQMAVNGLPTTDSEGRRQVDESLAVRAQLVEESSSLNDETKHVLTKVETQEAADKSDSPIDVVHEVSEAETQVAEISDSNQKKEQDSQEVEKKEAADKSEMSSEVEHEALETGKQVADTSSSSSTGNQKQESPEVGQQDAAIISDSSQKIEQVLAHSIPEDFEFDQDIQVELSLVSTNQSQLGRDAYSCSWPDVIGADITSVFWGFVNVSCRPGFEYVNGPQWVIAQCMDNNKWSPVPKSCTRVICPSLRSFTNANLNTTQVSYGAKVYVSCASGQELMRASSHWIITECRADRTWSVIPSNCLSATPGTPFISNIGNTVYAGSPVFAMAYLKDELFVTRQNAKVVLVYDSVTMRLTRQIAIPALGTHPQGLAVSQTDNCLYVSDFYNFRIHRVDLSTNIVTGWSVMYSHPRALSVTSNGNILVGTHTANKVLEYTSTGSLVREINDGNYLWQAVERNDGALVVVRAHPTHGILLATRDGRAIRAFGGGASAGTGMNSPRQTAVDSEGNIFVADTANNRIQLLDASLTTVRTLPLPSGVSLHYPHALSYDESRGRLFVGEESGQFRMIAFDGVTNIY